MTNLETGRGASSLVNVQEHLLHGRFTYPFGVSAADITRNGSLDLIVTDADVGIHLFDNDGRGNFGHQMIHERRAEWLERHAVADINRDGKLEIIAVDNINASILCFDHEGDPRDQSNWRTTYIAEGTLPGAYDVAIADVDADGDLDIITADWRIGNSLYWFENRGHEWVQHLIDENVGESRTIEVGPISRSGRPDILASGTGSGEVTWYENVKSNHGPIWRKHTIDVGASPYHGHLVDMTGNGRLDVVMAFADTSAVDHLVWYEAPDDVQRGQWTKHVIESDFPAAWEVIAGDIDNDGHVEVVATAGGGRSTSVRFGWSNDPVERSEGKIALFKHRGNPAGPWDRQTLKEDWPSAVQVILADLNGNGLLDIVASAERGSSEVRWWENLGSENGAD